MEEEVKTDVTNVEKKKNKKPLIITLSILGVLIVVSVILLVIYFIGGSRQVYKHAIKSAASKANEYLSNSIRPIDEGFVTSGNMSFETNIDEMKSLNDLKFSYSGGARLEDNSMQMKVKLDERKNSLEGTLFVKDGSVYLDSKDIYDKTLYLTEIEENLDLKNIFNSIDADELNYVANSVSKHLQNALKYATYKKGKDYLFLDGKKQKVTDNIMIINESNVEKVYKTFIEGIRNDKGTIEKLAKVFSVDKNDVISWLNNELRSDLSDVGSGELRFDIYTKGFAKKFVGAKLSADNDQVLMVVNTDKEFALIIENMLFQALKNKDNYDIYLKSDNQNILTGKYTKKDNGYVLNLKIEDIKIDIDIVDNSSDKNQDIKANVKIKSGKDYVSFNINNNVDYNKKTEKYNFKNAVDVNKLSEEDQEKIASNLDSKLSSSSIYGLLESIYDTYSYDYDYSEED